MPSGYSIALDYQVGWRLILGGPTALSSLAAYEHSRASDKSTREQNAATDLALVQWFGAALTVQHQTQNTMAALRKVGLATYVVVVNAGF